MIFHVRVILENTALQRANAGALRVPIHFSTRPDLGWWDALINIDTNNVVFSKGKPDAMVGTIKFVNPDAPVKALLDGLRFDIFEGPKKLGSGVLDLQNTSGRY
jgi:hypothetical protein